MKGFESIYPKVLDGKVSINGHDIMAFLANFSETGGMFDVEDIIVAAGGESDPRRNPAAFVNANRPYLEELAKVSKCRVDDLIGMRPKDGRYWCVHQVAVRVAGWVSPKLQVAFDKALIEFAKSYMQKACEWLDKRSESKQIVQHYNDVIDSEIDTPCGKEDGIKFGVMHKAIQGPFNAAQGGPKDTKSFKELNKVSAAMDAYDTPWLVGVNLARSVTIANVKRKSIRDLWTARDEAEDNARQISEKIGQLLSK